MFYKVRFTSLNLVDHIFIEFNWPSKAFRFLTSNTSVFQFFTVTNPLLQSVLYCMATYLFNMLDWQ